MSLTAGLVCGLVALVLSASAMAGVVIYTAQRVSRRPARTATGEGWQVVSLDGVREIRITLIRDGDPDDEELPGERPLCI